MKSPPLAGAAEDANRRPGRTKSGRRGGARGASSRRAHAQWERPAPGPREREAGGNPSSQRPRRSGAEGRLKAVTGVWAGLGREWAERWGERWPRSAPGPAQGFCQWCSRHALGAESVLPASQCRFSLHSHEAGCSPCVLTDDSGTHGVTRSLWSHSQRPEGHCSQRYHTAQGRSGTTVLLTRLQRYHGISQRLFCPQCFFIVPDTPPHTHPSSLFSQRLLS